MPYTDPKRAKEYRAQYWSKNKKRLSKINGERIRHWRASHPEEYHQQKKDYYARHKIEGKAYFLKHKYGLTLEALDKLFFDQKGLCAICKKSNKRLTVDHCHTTGKVRGLLCDSCNGALGRLGDDIEGLERAIQYLKGTMIPKEDHGQDSVRGALHRVA